MGFILKRTKPRKMNVGRNELNDILFNKLMNSNPVHWYSYDKEDYITRGYIGNSDIYTIVDKIIQKKSVAKPYIYIDKEGVKSKSLKNSKEAVLKHRLNVHKNLEFADENNDLAELIRRPNNKQTWNDLMGLSDIFYLVQGEKLIYREAGDDNCAHSLHVVPSHKAEAIIEENPETGDYEIMRWRIDIGFKQNRTIPAKDVFHMAMPNPDFDEEGSQLRGMSKLKAGLKHLQLSDKALEAWVRSADNEGAKGILSPNHNNPELWLTPEQVVEVEKSIDEKIHGADNKNKVVTSGMPLQYTQIGLSPDGLNVTGGLDFSFKKLCDIYGVPHILFHSDASKYNNLKIANSIFVKEVILPLLNAEENKLNQWLVQPFRDRDNIDYVLDYDLSDYEELRLTSDEVDTYLKLYSRNDVRILMGGDTSDEEGMDMVMIEQGLVPISDLGITFDDL